MTAHHASTRVSVVDRPTRSDALAGGAAPARGPAAGAPVGGAERVATPPTESLVEVASALPAGKALVLGCGEGQDGIWLASHGWIVNAVDASEGVISGARASAVAAGVADRIAFKTSELSDWRPVSLYDLVVCAFSLPARGAGRSRMLERAAASVVPGGTILLTDLDASLTREGWMTERYLTTTEELERYLGRFRVERSAVRLARVRHGFESVVLPAALVVATRRTDLRTL